MGAGGLVQDVHRPVPPSQRCGLCQNFKQTTLTTRLYMVRTNLYPPATYENVPTRLKAWLVSELCACCAALSDCRPTGLLTAQLGSSTAHAPPAGRKMDTQFDVIPLTSRALRI